MPGPGLFYNLNQAIDRQRLETAFDSQVGLTKLEEEELRVAGEEAELCASRLGSHMLSLVTVSDLLEVSILARPVHSFEDALEYTSAVASHESITKCCVLRGEALIIAACLVSETVLNDSPELKVWVQSAYDSKILEEITISLYQRVTAIRRF